MKTNFKKVDAKQESKINRRNFLQISALVSAAAGAATLFPSFHCVDESAESNNEISPSATRSLTPGMLLNGTASVSKPLLASSQLSFRIGLARTRMSSYPCDSMDFVMMDLERPDNRIRHAHWCTGDLTGRLLEFLSCSEGVDGKYDSRLDVLFERILKQKRPSGFIGRYADAPANIAPEDDPIHRAATVKVFHGLLRYYDLRGDNRALEAAEGLAEQLWLVRDEWEKRLKSERGIGQILTWVTEPFARLYGITKDPRWMEFCGMIKDNLRSLEGRRCHSHGFLSTLRGLEVMTLITGDLSWNLLPEQSHKIIIEKHLEMPDGCISEIFPLSERNEGCSIADWMMHNLNQGLIHGDDNAYDKAERIFWNALAFNQFVTGGFGQRGIASNGYGNDKIQEAWWCCTQTGGMAMSEYARHTVTFNNNTIHVNFLTPGQFELPLPGNKWVSIKIKTAYPNRAEATIEADNVPNDIKVRIRVPSCVRNPQVDQTRTGNSLKVTFHGEIGHRIEKSYPGMILTYGPLILVPGTGIKVETSVSTVSDVSDSEGAPTGYIPQSLPSGVSTIKLDSLPDADGFVQLPLCPPMRPLPDFSYFDEGTGAPTWVEGTAVEVNLKYSNEKIVPVRFTPMCYNTSNLSLFETPIVFNGIE